MSCGALQWRLQSLDVTYDAFSDGFAELDGNGVSDESADRLDINRFAFSYEFVVARKALEDRSFSQRNCAILMRMSEATIPETKKLGGHRR